jgi:hypothetical protein
MKPTVWMTIAATNGNADRQPRNSSNTNDFGSREAPEVWFPHPAGGNRGEPPGVNYQRLLTGEG